MGRSPALDGDHGHRKQHEPELRLDEHHEVPIVRRARSECRRHGHQGDKGQVGDGQRDGSAQLLGRERAHIRALEDRDSGIGSQLPRQLGAPDIDRVDVSYAALEQAVGEATR